jgi:hypothetical protein
MKISSCSYESIISTNFCMQFASSHHHASCIIHMINICDRSRELKLSGHEIDPIIHDIIPKGIHPRRLICGVATIVSQEAMLKSIALICSQH